MEVEFIEIEEISESFTCRCCILKSEEQMDNIFDCIYENIDLQELLSIVAPVSIFPNDGEIRKSYSKFKNKNSLNV